MFLNSHKYLSLIALTFLISACAPSNKPKNSQTEIRKSAEQTTGYHNANTGADNYAAKRTAALTGIPLASTNNLCVDHFNFLKESKSDAYPIYTKNYSDIGNGYRFLNINKNIMDADAKKVYTMMLEMKLDTLCTKVKYSGYSVIKNKIEMLSDI